MSEQVKLKNETPPTGNQDVLNRVHQHFVVEKHPKCMKGPVCLYRSDEGEGCAIGILLPDSIAKDLEGSIGDLLDWSLSSFIELRKWLRRCTIEFLDDLQRWHDSNHPEFLLTENSLQGVAELHNLTIPE